MISIHWSLLFIFFCLESIALWYLLWASGCYYRSEVCSKWILYCFWRYIFPSLSSLSSLPSLPQVVLETLRKQNHPKSSFISHAHLPPLSLLFSDVSGTLRIWDTTQLEHPLKIELRVLSGPILDIAWSPDNQRLIVVGDGKERFGAALLWDSGASVGEITGHSKVCWIIKK